MAYADDVLAADIVRRQAHTVATTDAQHIQADAAFRQAKAAAAQKWGIQDGSRQAIISHGEVPPAGSWTPGTG